MAFNPFETFRKRSKSIFAVLGIVVMLTFVLSAGTGGQTDFFGQIGNIFGRGPRGSAVAEAYGETVRITEIEELRSQRIAANSFMALAENASQMNLAKDIRRDIQGEGLSKETKAAIDRVIGLKVESNESQEKYSAYMSHAQQMLFGPPAQVFARARQSAKPDSEDAKVLASVSDMVTHDVFNSMMPQPFFKTVGGSYSTKELLDFDLLLKKADRTGINFSPEAIRELVKRDTGGQLTKRDNGDIEQRLRTSKRFPNFSGEWLMKAVANEYKARAMLVTLEGNSPSAGGLMGMSSKGESTTLSARPGAVTPYDFYEFYRDRCMETNFTLFEIPTESLLPKVTEEPTAKERAQLFFKHREVEADANRDTPGFKESRKVKIDFVTVDAKEKRVADGVKPLVAASWLLSGWASAQSPGAGPVAALTQAAHPYLAESLPVLRELDARRELANSRIAPGEQFFFRPRDTSIYRAEPIVSLLGSLAGHPDISTIVAAQMLSARNVEIDHLRRLTPMVLQSWVAPFNATSANTFGWPALAYSLTPKPIPDALYLKDIVATLKKDQVRRVFEKDADEFRNKMNEAARDMFGPSPDKTKAEAAKVAAAKFAAEWAKARGLTIAGTKEAVSRTTILTDPALKPLVLAAEKDVTKDPADVSNTLVKKFFDDFPQQDPRLPPMKQTMAFDPEFFPNSRATGEDLDKPTILVWLSDELTPVTYNTLDLANKATNGETGKLVDAAWKLDKAKALAQAEADKLAVKVTEIAKAMESNKPGVEKQFAEIAYKKINVDGLAKLKFQHGATQASINYETSKIPKELVALPTPDFVDKLLDQRTKPLGSVVVLHDVPRAKFYVAVSTAKSERTVDQFRDVFNKVNAVGVSQNPLYSRFAVEEQRNKESRDGLLRLRAEAKLTENEEFLKSQKKTEEPE